MTAAAPLEPPHPYFGSKAEAADLIWDALGDPKHFIDPFCGSCAVLYARPRTDFESVVETVNDAWGFIPNFLRAIKHAPREVAKYADWPVSELDMHARHRWLLERVDDAFVNRLRREPDFYDPQVAGYFVWGQSIWIGSGWCVPGNEAKSAKLPHLAGAGQSEVNQNPHYGKGVFRQTLVREPRGVNQLPHLGGAEGSVDRGRGLFRKQLPLPPIMDVVGDDPLRLPARTRRKALVHYFRLIAARLQRVRIACGDWMRVLSPVIALAHGLTGILLDPPYGHAAKRTKKLYAKDSLVVAAAARAWALAHGANELLRIVLCGYEGEHEELEGYGWRVVSWKGKGGYGNQGDAANAGRERLWLSPHCVNAETQRRPQLALAF